jgi:curli biogenesis system outer membrane secretion channel CsgG
LINSGSYRIIERNQLHKVLEEQALGQSGVLDSETAVVVGKIMGIDAVVVGSISALNSALESDARILNVETGEAIAATHARGASADDLRQMAEALAEEISTRATAIPARAQADTTVGLKK